MAALQALLDCQISSWYPQFARVTFKTVLVPLPQPVLDWLVSDGLHLAPDSQAFAKRGQLEEYPDEDDYQDWQSEDGSGSSSGSASEAGAAAQPPPPELAGVVERLQAGIEELGGRVVPKLSWSCPKDTVWMSPTASLCCTNADEVLLLLRSSDRVAHDICHAVQDAAAGAAGDGSGAAGDRSDAADSGSVPAVQHCLALRRWYDLQPGREFRCFVRGQALVGASQRDVTQCFDFLREERAELAAAIAGFHAKHIQGRFPQPDFTYDCYVAASGAVRLVDFNPAGGTTAPLLFSWEELGLGPAAAAAAADGADAAAAAAAPAEPAPGAAAAGADSAAAGGACQGCCGAEAPAAAEPSYLEQLRRVQALSLGEQPAAGGAGGDATAAAAPPAAPAAASPGDGGSSSGGAGQPPQLQQPPNQPQLDFRVIEEPVAMRPATLAYGVPFDFVDGSEGSALDRLMQQAQQAGAAELWEALAAGRQGGGGSGGAGAL